MGRGRFYGVPKRVQVLSPVLRPSDLSLKIDDKTGFDRPREPVRRTKTPGFYGVDILLCTGTTG